MGLSLAWGLCFLSLPFDSSVHWCLIRWIWVACISPAICLICLAVAFELSYVFASWCTLLAGNLSRSTLPSFMVLETNSSSHRRNQNMSLWKIFAVSGGYFVRLTCACTQLYLSSTLFDPWWKLVNKSNLACTSLDWGLQNSSNQDQIFSNSNSSFVKPHDTYWSIPKSPLQAMTFLHCWGSGRAASSHSSMFSHFKLPFQEVVVQAIINCPIHFGSLYVWHEQIVHCWIGCLWVCLDGMRISFSDSWSKSCALHMGTGYIYFLVRDCRSMSFS